MTTSSTTNSTLNQFNPLRHPVKFVLTLLTIFVIYTVWLATHLDIGKEPQEADVIIVPGGELIRDLKAIELFHKGYSLSGKFIHSPLEKSSVLFKLLQENGIREDQITLEPEATSTWTNATKSIEIMEKNNWESALIVTTDYHSRRTRLSYERAAKGKKLNFIYVSAHFKDSDGSEISYLNSPYRWKIIWSEIYKSYGYYLGLYHWIDL